MRYFVIRNGALQRVMTLLKCRHRHISLYAIRFMGVVVSTKDEQYLRYIVAHNQLEPLMELLRANSSRDNLITSCILELVEFVRTESLKTLVIYLVERLSPYFDDFQLVDSFDKLKLKYEQIQDALSGPGLKKGVQEDSASSAPLSKRFRGPTSSSWDEDSYFETDSDSPVEMETGASVGTTQISRTQERSRDRERDPLSLLSSLYPAEDGGSGGSGDGEGEKDRISRARGSGESGGGTNTGAAGGRSRSSYFDEGPLNLETRNGLVGPPSSSVGGELGGFSECPLPPLRPKYGDDDEDDMTPVFIRSRAGSGGGGALDSGSRIAGSNLFRGTGGGGQGGVPGGASEASRSGRTGVYFSMAGNKRKPVRLT